MIIVWSVLLRSALTAIEASSTLVVGFFVAAIMRRMLGTEGICKLFGGGGAKGLIRAWAIGLLLPVCALGVIPVARQMRRAGVPPATILAFVLAAPQLNPLSFLYGLTLSEPIVIVTFALIVMPLALLGGYFWKCLLQKPSDELLPRDEPTPLPGIKRLAAVFMAASVDTVGASMLYVLAGILFSGLLAGLVPHGYLSTTMQHDDWRSPLLMALIGVPVYSGVLPGMMRIGLMFEHGNSVGAAFVLFQSGVGLNLGLIVLLASWFGWKRILLWLMIVLTLVLGIAYTMENPLYFAMTVDNHTHAFDDWTRPFQDGMEVSWEAVVGKLRQKVEVLELFALAILGVLMVVGAVVTQLDPAGRVEAWLVTAASDRQVATCAWDCVVPAPALGLVALLGLVVFSFVALYIYYPDQKEAFAEIAHVRTDAILAVRTRNTQEAIRQIQRWDLLTRKLQVGVFIRTGRMPPEANAASQALRHHLELLRDALLDGNLVEANALIPVLEAEYRKYRACYQANRQ